MGHEERIHSLLKHNTHRMFDGEGVRNVLGIRRGYNIREDLNTLKNDSSKHVKSRKLARKTIHNYYYDKKDINRVPPRFTTKPGETIEAAIERHDIKIPTSGNSITDFTAIENQALDLMTEKHLESKELKEALRTRFVEQDNVIEAVVKLFSFGETQDE